MGRHSAKLARWAAITGLVAVVALGVAAATTAIVFWVVQPLQTVPVPTFAPSPTAITYSVTGAGQAQVSGTDSTGRPVSYGLVDLPWSTTVLLPAEADPWLMVATSSRNIMLTCQIQVGGQALANRGRSSVMCPGD